ncbi:DUF721 domain-containing protein [Kordiimonas aquimaris]|uniref:DUF721 domain-containing protein n=1 Tax=Kordiimonas aquimaris TaxID=707591 RepID=UPI0021D0751D|nr:DciA family protein [Kordiimonas aquimaris]
MAKAPAKKSTAPSKRKGRTTKLARSATALISPAMRAKGFAEAEVVTKWARIVGPDLARTTIPLRLAFPRGKRAGATLHVRAESAFAPILQQRTNFIIELVNRYFGYGAVERIQVKQGPLNIAVLPKQKEKKPLEPRAKKTLDGIVGTNDLSPLQLAVKSLGEYVMSPNQKNDKNK